ncbi:MAG: autotransporter-associated beta strand repeat-containing protein [Thermoguttaceae bacterium]|nr:autotransporter-associated beta strand repeat-containing protein [Thermoguttaceae bacterium]
MSQITRISLAIALSLALSASASATPVLPGGGTLSGTIAILGDGSIEYADDVEINAAGVTIAVGAVEYLVVGGGGGGGTNTPYSSAGSGGGGAGGLVAGTLAIIGNPYDVVVGAGGDPGPDVPGHNDRFGFNGEPSQFGSITAIGGGGGAGGNNDGLPGGSGGGGRSTAATPPGDGGAALQPDSESGGLGHAGGAGRGGGGGGGGAGSEGSSTSSSPGGNGGAGIESSITGESAYYAGGGGGGAAGTAAIGIGGSGVGGSGANNSTEATPGAPNSGGGGGGGNNLYIGAVGGSGVVYIRYAGNEALASGGDDIWYFDGYTLHEFAEVGASTFALNASVNVTQQATISGVLSGEGGLRVAGPGTLVLSGANTFSGDTRVDAGILRLEHGLALQNSTLASGPVEFDSSVTGNAFTFGGLSGSHSLMLANNSAIPSAVALRVGNNHQNTDFADTLSGPGSLIKVGSGVLVLSGINTYEGGTEVDEGALVIASTDALPGWNVGGRYSVASGAILAAGAAVSNDDVNAMQATGNFLGGASIGFDTSDGGRTYAHVIANTPAGSLGLTKLGSGTLTLTEANTYTGATNVDGGVIALSGGDNRLPTSTVLGLADAAGAALDLNGHDQQIRSLAGGGDSGGNIINTGPAASVLTIRPTSDTTFDGLIEGDIRLEVTGSKSSPSYSSPRQRLRNAGNSYTGGTLVHGATLLARHDGALGAIPQEFDPANITLQSNGVLFNDGETLVIHENRGITLGSGGGGFSAGFNRNVAINSPISGAEGSHLTIIGNNATVVFAGNNTYEGETRLTSSTSRLQIGDGGTSGSLGTGGVVNHGLLTFDRSDEVIVPNSISGSGSVTQTGSGTLMLVGNNSYEGGTIVARGTLRVSSTDQLPGWDLNGAYTVASGAALAVGDAVTNDNVNTMLATGNFSAGAILGFHTSGDDRTFPDPITDTQQGSLGLIKTGPNTLGLIGVNTYSGATRILDGRVVLHGGDDRLPATTALELGDSADLALDLNGYNQQVASLAGGGADGGDVINSGAGTSILTIRPDIDITFHGRIEGDIRLAVTGDKTSPSYSQPRQRLHNANNSYTGGTLIDGGTLLVRYDGALGKLPDEFEPDHITLQNNGVLFHDSLALDIHENRGIMLGEGGGGLSAGFSRDVTINSRISGAADNPLTIIGNSATVIFAGNNTYAGETRLASSTSRLHIGNGGTSGSLGIGNVVNNGSLTFNRSDELLVPNAISGSGTLTQAGPGTTVLSGENTYGGGTTVSVGTLLVNNASGSGTGSGPVAVELDATLGGTGTIGGVTTVESGGALAPGASIGTLNFLDELILDAGAVFEWEFTEAGDAGEHYDLITGPKLVLPDAGEVDLRILALGNYSLNAGDSFMLFEGDVYQAGGEEPLAAGYDVTSLFDFNDDFNWWGTWEVAANVPGYNLPGNLILTAVPEPGTAMLLLAVLGCGLLVRRRR